MPNIGKTRNLHKLLDKVAKSEVLRDFEVDRLRASLPELPEQMSLKEIREFVDNAAHGTMYNVWRDDVHGELAPFLHEVSSQLEGLINAEPATVPALPEGMRLADHKVYGRCVTSPECNNKGERLIFGLTRLATSGATWEYVDPDTLTYIDSEPARPRFLETEADYENAPVGTIVACDDSPSWHKRDSLWQSVMNHGHQNAKYMSGIRRRVLRWGWGE